MKECDVLKNRSHGFHILTLLCRFSFLLNINIRTYERYLSLFFSRCVIDSKLNFNKLHMRLVY